MKRDHVPSPTQRLMKDQLDAAAAVCRNWTTDNMEACPPAVRNTVAAFVIAHCRLLEAVARTQRLQDTPTWRRGRIA